MNSLFREGKGHIYPRKKSWLDSCGGISLVGARTLRTLHLHTLGQQEPGYGNI